VSWWDWQEAATYSWRAISNWITKLSSSVAFTGLPVLSKGSAGDLVVWAQEHLQSAGEVVAVDGGFGPKTLSAVKSFQLAHGLTVDGIIGAATWSALLAYQPAAVTWSKPSKKKTGRLPRRVTAVAVAGADNSDARTPGTPLSALLPSRGQELSGSPGAGRP
jgi:peptidoglycan hydrolase-like protein with peptidoglycan-binding domain